VLRGPSLDPFVDAPEDLLVPRSPLGEVHCRDRIRRQRAARWGIVVMPQKSRLARQRRA
jgi:hypothetical protein